MMLAEQTLSLVSSYLHLFWSFCLLSLRCSAPGFFYFLVGVLPVAMLLLVMLGCCCYQKRRTLLVAYAC